MAPPSCWGRRARNSEAEIRHSAATAVTPSLSLAITIYKMGSDPAGVGHETA